MSPALPWLPAWPLAAVLLTATPLAAGAAEPSGTPVKPAPPTPAVKPAATAPTGAAKPATATPTAAAKPATASPTTAAKPATATPAAAAKPATASPATAAKSPTATAPNPAAAKPGVPAAAAPGAAKAATPAGPVPVAASAPHSADPAQGHISLAVATNGIKGVGALFATIEIAAPGKPVQALHCELFTDKTPLTVANFVALARGLRPWKDPKLGQWLKKPLYDGNQLHRVVPELLIQGGDPGCTIDPQCRSAAGLGEPGYSIPDEIRPELRFDRPGRLAMANRGPATSGSQFFITEREAHWLTGSHTIFGQCDGPELVTELSHVAAGARDQPTVPLVIKRVTFMRKVK